MVTKFGICVSLTCKNYFARKARKIYLISPILDDGGGVGKEEVSRGYQNPDFRYYYRPGN